MYPQLSNMNIMHILIFLKSFLFKQIPHSSELVFVDSSSNMEELNLRVFLVCTHSVVGALPLGVVITSDESEETLDDAFNHLKFCMGVDAFYSNGYPTVIMTDNCDELRDSLHTVWPNAKLLLCIFHILQQVSRWLHEKKHDVRLEDRPHLFSLIKAMLYAKDDEELNKRINLMRQDEIINCYGEDNGINVVMGE